MTMTVDQMIQVLSAYKAGKKIESRLSRHDDDWMVTSEPVWNFRNYKYRVKAEPREYYLLVNEHGEAFGAGNPREALSVNKAYIGSMSQLRTIKVREVLE